MVQSKGIGMVFDGEGLAYYYKDLEMASWWKSQNGNWNTALSEAITANKSYIDATVSAFEFTKNAHFPSHVPHNLESEQGSGLLG